MAKAAWASFEDCAWVECQVSGVCFASPAPAHGNPQSEFSQLVQEEIDEQQNLASDFPCARSVTAV